MLSIKNELEEKIEEASILLEHILEVSLMKKSVQKSSILKSAYVLLLYNIVESTTRLIFELVHDNLALHSYSQFSDNIKKLYRKFHFKNNSKLNNETVDDSSLCDIKFPSLEQYIKKITLYSGNLDARELNKIIKEYDIGIIDCESRKNLLTIKNKRNKLAHGEEKFKDSCRGYTIKELSIFKDSINETLQQLIGITEKYLEEKRYLISSSLPSIMTQDRI